MNKFAKATERWLGYMDDDVGTPCALELPCITNAKPSPSSPFITPISKHDLNVFTLERKGANQLNLSNCHVELTHTTHKCPKCTKECSLCKRLNNFPPSFTHCFSDLKKKKFLFRYFSVCAYPSMQLSTLMTLKVVHSRTVSISVSQHTHLPQAPYSHIKLLPGDF